MFQKLFSDSSWLDLPPLAMVGFLALFTGVVIWVCSSRRSAHYQRMSKLPLQDGPGGEDEVR